MLSTWMRLKICHLVWGKPFPKRQILDSTKLNEFADDNFKYDENGGKFIKRVENIVKRGEIACNACFQKT